MRGDGLVLSVAARSAPPTNNEILLYKLLL